MSRGELGSAVNMKLEYSGPLNDPIFPTEAPCCFASKQISTLLSLQLTWKTVIVFLREGMKKRSTTPVSSNAKNYFFSFTHWWVLKGTYDAFFSFLSSKYCCNLKYYRQTIRSRQNIRLMHSDVSPRSYLAFLKALGSLTWSCSDLLSTGSALPRSAPEVLSLNKNRSKKVYFEVWGKVHFIQFFLKRLGKSERNCFFSSSKRTKKNYCSHCCFVIIAVVFM